MCTSVGSVQLPWTGAKIDTATFPEPSERLGDGRKAVSHARLEPSQALQSDAVILARYIGVGMTSSCMFAHVSAVH